MASAATPAHLLTFGTYRLHGEVLDIAIGMAAHAMTQHGIVQPLLDTALIYNNTKNVLDAVSKYPNLRVGTKLHRSASVAADLAAEKSHYGARLTRALLHKHMPVSAYLELVRAKAANMVQEIGVSNYSAAQLRDLCAALRDLESKGELPLPFAAAKPDVCQNEFHPFLRTTVPTVCAELGIRFEAHSTFFLLDEYPLEWRNANGPDGKPQPTVGQRALAYALQRGGGSVAFNTANFNHLQENLDIVTLSEEDLAVMDALKAKACKARYAGSDTAAFSPVFACDDPANGSGFLGLPLDYIREAIGPAIRADIAAVERGDVPSKVANGIPSARIKNPVSKAAHLELANAIFLDESTGEPKTFHADPVKDVDAKIKKAQRLLTSVRRALLKHDDAMKAKAKPMVCKLRAVEDPEALPVDIPDPAVLQPFFDLVAETKALPDTAIRMERGVLFPDGRLDFCKQVAQPAFGNLCEAVLKSGVVKHFLIGNNVALANDTTGEREAALGKLIRESKGIETWYLAGNAIGKDAAKTVAEAVASNPDSRYVWLKMNPVQTGSKHFATMLTKNHHVEVLDLFNTGQCDDGVNAFVEGLAADPQGAAKSNLQHLYLDINAITDGAACAKIAALLPRLESYSINVNQLRDAGFQALAEGLLAIPADRKPPLKRFVVGSNGLTDASLPLLQRIVEAYPTLTVLQLGSYKSTRFFQQQSNVFASYDGMLAVAKALAANAKRSATPTYNYFGFQHAYVTDDAEQLVLAVAEMKLHANGVQWNSRGQATITSKQLNELLGSPVNVQPPPVEYIQSVYRNSM